jgi:glycosyltransferase involved in cell wall biosynthesis
VAQKYDAPIMRQKIREILRKQQIDLVHVDMLPLTVYVNEFNHLPKVLVNHNVESVRLYRWFKTEHNPLKKAYLGIQWLKLRSFERSVMSKFDCCVVVSKMDRQLLREMGVSNKLFVVPNGTDTNFFSPEGEASKENSVLWIGHMDVHTNKDAVLYFWRDIWPVLVERHPSTMITFVGTAPPKEIREVTKKNPQVKTTGFVDDIRPYVHEAAVIVVPIRIGSGTRIKILDTMAMGKAIVSTSVGCEGLDVTHGKDILISDDPKDFADSIIKILKNQHMRSNLERNARYLARTYDWDFINEKQELAYQYALGRERI